jgi:BlaI family penicillinase repressor
MANTATSRTGTTRSLPQISEAEWTVMRVLWHTSPLSTNEVVEALESQAEWKPKTIHTLLNRLVRKGALAFQRQGRLYEFRPLVAAEDCEHAIARSFLSRFFDGELAPFLARFVEREKLAPQQVERLNRILDGKEP